MAFFVFLSMLICMPSPKSIHFSVTLVQDLLLWWNISSPSISITLALPHHVMQFRSIFFCFSLSSGVSCEFLEGKIICICYIIIFSKHWARAHGSMFGVRFAFYGIVTDHHVYDMLRCLWVPWREEKASDR